MEKAEKIDKTLIEPRFLDSLNIRKIKSEEFERIAIIDKNLLLKNGENFMSLYNWIEYSCGDIIDWDCFQGFDNYEGTYVFDIILFNDLNDLHIKII